jgi:hypothetical protein
MNNLSYTPPTAEPTMSSRRKAASASRPACSMRIIIRTIRQLVRLLPITTSAGARAQLIDIYDHWALQARDPHAAAFWAAHAKAIRDSAADVFAPRKGGRPQRRPE